LNRAPEEARRMREVVVITGATARPLERRE
jgi:hypothetical protein